MSKEIVVRLIDDLDGSEAHRTVSFGVDGHHYEIDLSEEHARQFDERVSRWVRMAREVPPARTARRTTSRPAGAVRVELPSGRTFTTQQVRAWARQNHLRVSARGNLSVDVVRQFRLAAIAAEAAQDSSLPDVGEADQS